MSESSDSSFDAGGSITKLPEPEDTVDGTDNAEDFDINKEQETDIANSPTSKNQGQADL